MRQLLATGADLVLVSAQKYLGAPTAGLVMGRAGLVAAVRAQEKGIGRGMKATKEAIASVLAALAEQEELNIAAWAAAQARIVDEFAARAGTLPGLAAWAEPDPTGLPFPRAHLRVDPDRAGMGAPELAMALRAGSPSIWMMDHCAELGELVFELVALRTDEVEAILGRLTALMA
ncbi:hypothetical protein JMJ56_18960 [Belnapia sp. T18]|uniref:Uncharacterized protein n=2 Tax=Belnapia arida TaxID=2804533 RepID=A0ABS1U5Z1_9PROT|nr:hypothetical protein [Belnapia arida]